MSQTSGSPSIRIDLLHSFRVLEADELPTRVLAVGADVDLWSVDEVLADLVGVPLDDGPARLVPAGDGRFALRPAPDTAPFRNAVVARRIGEDLLVALDTCAALAGVERAEFDYEVAGVVLPAVEFADRSQASAWLARHRPLLTAAVRANTRAGCYALAVALAARVWSLPPGDAGPAWGSELSWWSTEAAIEARRPEALAGLLAASARWFADAGDFVTAEQHGIRESRTRRRIGAPDGIAAALWRRAGIYHRSGHLHFALDCYRELSADYLERGDRHGRARALAATGVTLLASGRPNAAAERLDQAMRLYDDLPDSSPVERADVLEDLGRALWRLGEHGVALRRLDEALSLLVDVDDAAADRVRRLRAGLPER
ncbi:tetratricopeptide (TPR) repeat protein [Saccharothrix tamanrassetensis]|uniref:Tetratricopeptide (TPR) repeat protein n=1 Tax=Saccharothrix tamanrassetensis TaxID=1051531 RepID=A0A841CC91_9PSEU|nr:tetratricopeptide repeat protein [Saccharothrix tamanrassetensis]MBB5953625.1 tetratricopeptide (TPR) repeat protein [Saccharothrix tamanrassetensis]